jgi:hypothetical protein
LILEGCAVPWVVLDSNQALWGQQLYGLPVRGGDEKLSDLKAEGVDSFVVGLAHGGREGADKVQMSAGLKPSSPHHGVLG